MKLLFADKAWEDLSYWIETDRNIARRIVKLVNDCLRDPFSGIGKPEPLRDNLAGYWSRRITDEHRLVYKVSQGELWIPQARYHYSK